MLFGELKFYKNDEIVKVFDDEVFSEFNTKELDDFVKGVVADTGATKVISSCIYHGGAKGTIDTILFPYDHETKH